MAKGDMFLKIDDVKGESADDSHKGEIDILSWSWGATQGAASHLATGSTTGKVAFSDLTCVKNADRTTPVLLGMCAAGGAFKKAVLVVRKAGGPKPLEYIKITMENGIISSHTFSGTGGGPDGHTETFTLNFATVKVEYTPQKADGSGDAVVTTAWNIAKNVAM
jgi:type VI secretion system secreted protein Hcp